MSRKTKAEITRENFTKMRGGKLISIEAYILGFVVLFALSLRDVSPIVSFIVAAVVGFAFPILLGTFKSLAWLAAILFSLVWALVVYAFASLIANGFSFIGLLFGIIFFVISFAVHKKYSGLTFQKINKMARKQQVSSLNNPINEEAIFCPKCGRHINSIDGRCEFCDK